jgi:hypothetical protein
MKPTIFAILLLACGLAFGQKLQDASANGSPLSLLVKNDHAEMGPYAAARNKSDKAILAMVAIVRATDEKGGVHPCHSYMDYTFKSGGVLAPEEERFACLIKPADAGAKVTSVDGAVLFVQFDDGTIWGDRAAGEKLLAARPQKLAFLQKLVETYYASGEGAFSALLNDGRLGSPEDMLAECLKSDADYRKVPTIEMAKKLMAAAQGWRALGIF